MTNRARLPLPLAFTLICHCFNVYAIGAQKLQNEVTRLTEGSSDTVCQTSRQNNADYRTVFVVNRTTASSRPCPFVEDYFATAFSISGSSIRSDITSRREWFDRAEGKSSKSDWGAIGRSGVSDTQWPDTSRHFIHCFANCQIERSVKFTVSEQEPMNLEVDRISLPFIVRGVDSQYAGNRSFRSNHIQISDHVPSSNEMAVFVNEKSSPIYKLNSEYPILIEASAQNGNNRTLDAVDRQDEPLAPVASTKSKNARKKSDISKDANEVAKSHNSGVLVLQNDGKAVGCDTTKQSSSTISISCPQVDSVKLHQEDPQSSKRD